MGIWYMNINKSIELNLFATLHPAFCESIFWYISRCKFEYRTYCNTAVKIISMLGRNIERTLCVKCGQFYDIIAVHGLLHCYSTKEIREKLFCMLLSKYGSRVSDYFRNSCDVTKTSILLGAPIPDFISLLTVEHIDFVVSLLYYIHATWLVFKT